MYVLCINMFDYLPIYFKKGRDVIGLAETGSGKTGAFALPVLQALRDNPQSFFGLVLTPTRELAFQIAEQFNALGEKMALRVAALVGGMDMVSQAVMIGKKPHIIIATPGRFVWFFLNMYELQCICTKSYSFFLG